MVAEWWGQGVIKRVDMWEPLARAGLVFRGWKEQRQLHPDQKVVSHTLWLRCAWSGLLLRQETTNSATLCESQKLLVAPALPFLSLSIDGQKFCPSNSFSENINLDILQTALWGWSHPYTDYFFLSYSKTFPVSISSQAWERPCAFTNVAPKKALPEAFCGQFLSHTFGAESALGFNPKHVYVPMCKRGQKRRI